MAGVSHDPPDGGWGWFIVLSSFLLQALTIGITYTFGVIFVKFMHVFGADEATTSWIGSIQPCLLYLTGKYTFLSTNQVPSSTMGSEHCV